MLRTLILRLLRATAFDFRIRHHWSKDDKLLVNSFLHRSYWVHGIHREQDDLKLVSKLIENGDTVVEVGAHIGYLSLYFRKLVGDKGAVHIFEPTPETLHYLRANVISHPNINLNEVAVSDKIGKTKFFVEHLSGQNNSLVAGHGAFLGNSKEAGVEAEMTAIDIDTVTLDNYVFKHSISPCFVKIDIEEAELMAIKGMIKTIETYRPICMIEVVVDKHEIHDIFESRDYSVVDNKFQKAFPDILCGANRFFIPVERMDEIKSRLDKAAINGRN